MQSLCAGVRDHFLEPSTHVVHPCDYVCYPDNPGLSPIDCQEMCPEYYNCTLRMFRAKKHLSLLKKATHLAVTTPMAALLVDRLSNDIQLKESDRSPPLSVIALTIAGSAVFFIIITLIVLSITIIRQNAWKQKPKIYHIKRDEEMKDYQNKHRGHCRDENTTANQQEQPLSLKVDSCTQVPSDHLTSVPAPDSSLSRTSDQIHHTEDSNESPLAPLMQNPEPPQTENNIVSSTTSQSLLDPGLHFSNQHDHGPSVHLQTNEQPLTAQPINNGRSYVNEPGYGPVQETGGSEVNFDIIGTLQRQCFDFETLPKQPVLIGSHFL